MTADELYHQQYRCPGPTRLVGNAGGLHAFSGTLMTIDRCMAYPDCGCRTYDHQVILWEAAQEDSDDD